MSQESKPSADLQPALNVLSREEYVEQAYFFGVLAERMASNVPMQEVLGAVREEVLATTNLPLAIDFMLAELRHIGTMAQAMFKLAHYFTPFQAFVIGEAENDRQRFDLRVALLILQKEATYRAEQPTRQGFFLFQFEVLCRNRLGYDAGLLAIADDPVYDAPWREWARDLRHKVGVVDVADLIYVRSEHYRQVQQRSRKGTPPPEPLFGEQEGRIALANRRKDPLYLFSSLHRQLGYPEVPMQVRIVRDEQRLPAVARRVEQLAARLKLVEEELRGGFDLTKFYVKE